MAAVPLPDNLTAECPAAPHFLDSLQDALLAGHGIEVPVIPWPSFPKQLLRVSAQLYNTHSQYQMLAEALKKPLHLF